MLEYKAKRMYLILLQFLSCGCDLHPAMMIPLNCCKGRFCTVDTVPRASLKFFYHLWTIRHPGGHWFEPGWVTWKWKEHLTFWPLVPGGPGKPMGPGSPCTTKTSRINMFHWNMTQGYKHTALNILSAPLDIWYGELADVVWFLLLF